MRDIQPPPEIGDQIQLQADETVSSYWSERGVVNAKLTHPCKSALEQPESRYCTREAG